MRPHRRTEAPSPGGPRHRPGGSPAPANAPDSPELLLVCEAWSTSLADGRWRFSIESAVGDPVLEAADEEPGDLNRLSLLAAVRGLEAIDGPAAVMLLSTNRYLIRSLAESLPRWRAHDFAWEHFGRVIDIQHADLWRRIDRALRIHRVEACLVSSRLVSPGRLPVTAPSVGSPASVADHAPAPTAGSTAEFAHAPAETTSHGSDDGQQMWRVDGPHAQPNPPSHAQQTDGLRRLLLGSPATGPRATTRPNDEPLPNSATTPANSATASDHFALRDHLAARDDAPSRDRSAVPARRRGQRRHRFTAADLVETG